MARNNSIFQYHNLNIQIVAKNAKSWFAETFGLLNSTLLASPWKVSCSQPSGKNMNCVKPAKIPSWKFCGNAVSLKKIWLNSASAVIFFDGAFKGNLGACRASGVVLYPDRSTKYSFSWGLGTMSNNQTESYNLLMATQLAKEKGFKSVLILGDSEMGLCKKMRDLFGALDAIET